MMQILNQSQATNKINQWQINEINAALKEAEAGDFATEAEVRVVINKWKVLQVCKRSSRDTRP